MTKEGLLTVKDVVRILNVSRRTLYNWIQKGTLKPIRIGKLYRFHPDDIESFIERGRANQENRKVKILAVDDDILVRKSLAILLEKAGFEVTAVGSGEEAIQKIQDTDYDLVLTDVRMPGMDGIQTLKEIRNLRGRSGMPAVPEVVISAYNDQPAKDEMRRMGIKNFVSKPFEWDHFLETIRENLN